VLEDGALASRLSEAAKSRAIEQFGVGPFVEHCQKLYGEALTP